MKLTSTEVVRRFGDILAEVKHGGQTVIVTKNGEPVAELRPLESARRMTLRRFVAEWGGSETDEPELNLSISGSIENRKSKIENLVEFPISDFRMSI